ncbi:MAG: hypothetical protein R6T99_08125 [Bacteroidales bacterium]
MKKKQRKHTDQGPAPELPFILKDKKKSFYPVHEGYFDDFPSRLREKIVQKERKSSPVPVKIFWKPALAGAASVLILLALALFFMQRNSGTVSKPVSINFFADHSINTLSSAIDAELADLTESELFYEWLEQEQESLKTALDSGLNNAIILETMLASEEYDVELIMYQANPNNP